jgi:hypothetical protein
LNSAIISLFFIPSFRLPLLSLNVEEMVERRKGEMREKEKRERKRKRKR